MVKNKLKYQACSCRDEKIKEEMLQISADASELEKQYLKYDLFSDKGLIRLYNEEWELYLRFKKIIVMGELYNEG